MVSSSTPSVSCGVVRDLLGGLPALGGGAVEDRRQHELKVGLLLLGEPEARRWPRAGRPSGRAPAPGGRRAGRGPRRAAAQPVRAAAARAGGCAGRAGRCRAAPPEAGRSRAPSGAKDSCGTSTAEQRSASSAALASASGSALGCVLVQAPDRRVLQQAGREAERGVVQHDRVVVVTQGARRFARTASR